MRQALFIIFLVPLIGFAQVKDNFSDGNFTANPAWIGDVSDFEVDANLQLHLNAVAQTEESHLSTALSIQAISEWEFYVSMGFNPSGSNLFDFHLMSDSADLELDHNGYFVRVGGSDDEVSLFLKSGASETKIMDGADDRVNLSPVDIWIKVLRFANGDWKVYSRLENESEYMLEGEVNELTHTNSSFSGVLCDYTSSRSTLFWFDDFGYNQAPELKELTVVDSNTLLLEFDEAVSTASASQVSNYNVNDGIGAPSTAIVSTTSPEIVELNFTNSFALVNSYNLTITSIADTLGNVNTSQISSFQYLQFTPPSFQDIVINEIMADPSPSVGLPEIEFIEIYNRSSSYFDLSLASFGDPSTIGSVTTSEIIAPMEYIILCDEEDTASFSSFGRVIGLTAFPGLNNAGDIISLYVDSILIDRIAYSSAWYGDDDKDDGGYTLEQINPTNPCNGLTNWAASENANGGTPGQENSVYDTTPDTENPEIIDYALATSSTIQISFSEKMDSSSLASATYSIDNGLTIVSVSISPETFDSVTLQLSAPADSSVFYTVSISAGITDCIGNPLGAQSLEFGVGSIPKPYDLVITEVYRDPDEASALPAAEFVEIYNRSDKLLRLEGLSIADPTSSSAIFTITLLPEEYAIICDNGNAALFADYGKVAAVTSMPSLNNASDSIWIMNGLNTIDAVFYSDSWYGDEAKDDGGFTLERINPNNLCGLTGNWSASNDPKGGTPGIENSVADFTDPGLPKLISGSFESLYQVRFAFDRTMKSESLESAIVTSNGTALALADGPLDFVSISAVSPGFERGSAYTFIVDSVADCVGNSLTNASIELYLPALDDIVINEVLFNPRGSGTDFVELFNQSDFDINLEGWSLAYYDTKDSLRFNTISETALVLRAGEYIALNEDSADLFQNYPQSAPDRYFTMNLPTYANDAGAVILYDQLGELLEQFEYSEDLHFALIDVTDGVSLERLDASRSVNDVGNWHSASSADNYATPGYLNSQDYPSSKAEEEFYLSADYISPDNDGYQDVVNIDYILDGPGNVATINIYTDKGVLIRELVSNLPLGNAGSITWDGTNGLGEKARTGIHVILIETFDLDGNRSQYRLPIVVAARL